MVTDYRYHYLDNARYYLNIFNSAIHYLANLPMLAGNTFYEYLQSRSEFIAQKNELENQNTELQAKLSNMAALKHKNQHLQSLLNLLSDKHTDKKFTVIKLVGVYSSLVEQKIIINKGRNDGVYTGQPVIGVNGIVGQVSSVTPISATVVLITSPGYTVLGQVARSSLRVVVRGIGNAERLDLLYIPTTADIKEGDEIITSGLSQKYPYGYPIGKVSSITKRLGSSFSTVTITPHANLNHNLEMLLVWSNTQKQAHQ